MNADEVARNEARLVAARLLRAALATNTDLCQLLAQVGVMLLGSAWVAKLKASDAVQARKLIEEFLGNFSANLKANGVNARLVLVTDDRVGARA